VVGLLGCRSAVMYVQTSGGQARSGSYDEKRPRGNLIGDGTREEGNHSMRFQKN